MENHLIIDGKDYGKCVNYYKCLEAESWCFCLNDENPNVSIDLCVPFEKIKVFYSCENYEIVTFK
ncbi:MAG: hypothetical protein J6K58_14205 [Lachnospiraceae bacterium]|nr:hypothetical protein [Lachnospiraceae bacterium]